MRIDPVIIAIPLACLIVLVGLLLVGVRGVRIVRERRRARIGEAPRRALLAFVAEAGEEGMDELLAIPPAGWRAAQPTALTLLGKVRGDAHRALAEVFERRGVTELAMADLTHRDAVRRASAAELLGDLRLTEAIKPLCRLLDDPRADVRVVAVRALGAIGDPAAAEPLLEALTHNVPSHMVADAVARIGVDSVPALHAALGHEDALVVVTALEALALIGATGSAEAVAAVLQDRPDPAVRIAAAGALGRLGGRAALVPLLAAVEPRNPSALRTAAARALGELGALSTGTALAVLLADPVYGVAHEAARALVRLGPAGLTYLREAVEKPDGGHAAEHAQEALALAALAGG